MKRRRRRPWWQPSPVLVVLVLLLFGHAVHGDQEDAAPPSTSKSFAPPPTSTSPTKTTALTQGPTPPETLPDYLAKAKASRSAPGRFPVVVLNGLGGAGLKFRLRGAKPSRWYCRNWYARYHTAWILPRVVIPPVARCLLDFITPVYDPATGKFRSKEGVDVQVKGFGQIVSLENLGPSVLPIRNFDYIKGFVRFMVQELGYSPGLDLFAAPYDWRYTPDTLKEQGYFTDLKALIETAYVTAGNRKVHVMGHSLGGVVALAFLNDCDPAWKRKYVKSYIPVGSPFGGTVVNVLGSVSGYNLGLPIPPGTLRDFEAQAPTGPWLFAQPSLWPATETLVQTPTQCYSAHDYERLLLDLGLDVAVPIYKHVAPLYLQTLVPPGIDTHVVHSEGNPTLASLVYNQSFTGDMLDIPTPPTLVYGPGDGTVPERSLLRPFYEWQPEGYTLTHHTMTGVDHMDSMNARAFFRILTDILGDNVERTLDPAADALHRDPDFWLTRKKQVWGPIEDALDDLQDLLLF